MEKIVIKFVRGLSTNPTMWEKYYCGRKMKSMASPEIRKFGAAYELLKQRLF